MTRVTESRHYPVEAVGPAQEVDEGKQARARPGRYGFRGCGGGGGGDGRGLTPRSSLIQ